MEKETVSQALLAKLYETLTAQPDVGAEGLPDDRFIAWCSPGLPYEKEDFLFAIRGIGGGEETVGEGGIDTAEGEPGGTITAGEDVRRRIIAASDWSRLANFIPNSSGIYDDEQQKRMFDTNAFAQDGSSILSVYRNVLDFSEVAASDLSDEQRTRIERFENLLTEIREEEDLLTGETREVIDDSRLVKAYKTYEQEYIDAAMEYNTKRLNALNSSDSAAVQDWALNGNLYRQKVRSAFNRWVAAGKKHQVEQMYAFIDQVSRRNLELLKARLLDSVEKSQINNPVSGEAFYWTSVIPARFAFSEGWQGYSFSQNEVKTHSKSKTNQWDASARIPISAWKIGGGTSGSTERMTESVDTSKFFMSFEVAQVMISRPWFSPEFLKSNGWRFEPDMPNLTNLTERLSDGEIPPSGSMIAYPTAAIFVRDVTLDFAELHKETSSFKRDIEADLGVSIGPFRIGKGSYKRGDEEREFESKVTNEGLEIPGMQLIGFKCKLLPNLPNPSDEVEQWA